MAIAAIRQRTPAADFSLDNSESPRPLNTRPAAVFAFMATSPGSTLLIAPISSAHPINTSAPMPTTSKLATRETAFMENAVRNAMGAPER